MGSDQAVKPGHPAIFISIHAPPHGERRENRLRLKPNGYISIHAPRMGSDVSCECISARQAYFNPRSRMGSDEICPVTSAKEFISIHAPAWGATRRSRRAYPCDLISIHAPAWGATISARSTSMSKVFQSTLPHGERQQKHEISSLFL